MGFGEIIEGLIQLVDAVLRDCGDWPWLGLGSGRTLNMCRAKMRALAMANGERRRDLWMHCEMSLERQIFLWKCGIKMRNGLTK